MSVALTYVWTAFILMSIISLCYMVLLVKTCTGTCYKIIIVTTVLLLFANIAYIALIMSNYVIIHYIMGDYPDMTDETLYKWDFVQAIC
jgi:hypothetical protein